MWHEALASLANGFLTVDSFYIDKIGQTNGTPELAVGAQFTRYRGAVGIVVDVVENPLYDQTMYSRRMHPMYPGATIDSARMTFLDFGTSQGENNIQTLSIKDSFSHGTVIGMVGPNGPIKNGAPVSSLKHGYDVGMQGSKGLKITDVTRTGELIYDYEF